MCANKMKREEKKRGKPFPTREWEKGEFEEKVLNSGNPGVDSEAWDDYLKEKKAQEEKAIEERPRKTS